MACVWQLHTFPAARKEELAKVSSEILELGGAHDEYGRNLGKVNFDIKQLSAKIDTIAGIWHSVRALVTSITLAAHLIHVWYSSVTTYRNYETTWKFRLIQMLRQTGYVHSQPQDMTDY